MVLPPRCVLLRARSSSGSEIYLSRDFEVVRDAVFLGLGVLEFAEPCPARPWSGSEVAEMSVQFDVSVRSRTCLVLYLYRRPGSSQLLCSMSRVVFFPAQNVLHYVLMCDTED